MPSATLTHLINVECDELIPVTQLVKDRLGKRISPATRWRWIKKGVGCGTGPAHTFS